MTYKILVSDKLDESGLVKLRNQFIVDIKTGLSEDELVKIIPEYHGLLIRSQTTVTARIIDAANQLKIIGRAGVGVDNVDLDAATRKGIIVVNSPEGNTIAAAEHSFALLLALARKIPFAHMSLGSHEWDRNRFTGVELYNKILGVVGLGKIGQRVASYGKAFGMKVVGFDPFVSHEFAEKMEIELLGFEDLLKCCDFLTLHVPKTKDTTKMINSENLSIMKKTCRIVNCARGGVIDEMALKIALESCLIAGAAVDVFDKEPAADSLLIGTKNLILTPHLGAATEEAQINVAIDVADQVFEVLNGREASSAVNIPSMKPAMVEPVKGFLTLSEKLGSLVGQIIDGGIMSIKISYHGEVADKTTDSLTTAVLKGLLSTVVVESVNYVNAAILAKARSIKVIEQKVNEHCDYKSLITIEVTSEKETRKISGAVLGDYGDMVVELDGIKVNTVPSGYILIVPNEDSPGVIGTVGTILGKYKVNINRMEVGRREGKIKHAIMVINVDSDIPAAVLTEISMESKIIGKAKLVKL